MRILFLAPDIQLGLNRGDSLHVRKLSAALATAGHVVDLLVASSAEASSGGMPGVKVVTRPGAGSLLSLFHALRVARIAKPEVIYERRFSPKLSAGIGALLRIPFAVEINGIPDEEALMQGRPAKDGVLGSLKEKVRVRLFRRAFAVVAVTPGIQAFVVSHFSLDPRKVFVVPNGVDSHLFYPMDRTEARGELGFPEGALVCFVGNLVQWQGIHTLLDALTLTAKDLTLVLVGGGPEENRLRQKAESLGISSRVRFVGDVAHEQVPRYIAASDVCVAPFTSARNSQIGVSALKVFEYIACGRPVVASDIPGTRELLADLQCGIVVPPDSPAALAQALSRAVDDKLLADASRAASDYVRSHYSWDATARAVGRILTSSMMPPRSPP